MCEQQDAVGTTRSPHNAVCNKQLHCCVLRWHNRDGSTCAAQASEGGSTGIWRKPQKAAHMRGASLRRQQHMQIFKRQKAAAHAHGASLSRRQHMQISQASEDGAPLMYESPRLSTSGLPTCSTFVCIHC